MNNEYLSDEEVNNLIIKAKKGDNEAWTMLCENYKNYIKEMVRQKTSELNITQEMRYKMQEDLVQDGWLAFVTSLKTYNPSKVKLTTYLYKPVNGAISKGLEIFLNPMGITERPRKLYKKSIDEDISISSDEELQELLAGRVTNDNVRSIEPVPSNKKYEKERTVLQILEVLKLLTDEKHTLSQEELFEFLWKYRIFRYGEDVQLEDVRTLRNTVKNIILELNPDSYSKENESKYKILYDGYEEDRLQKGEKGVTNFSYVHPFTSEELDALIEQICFSSLISADRKSELIEKLILTASVYYKNSFWNGESLKFNPNAVYGRLDSKNVNAKKTFVNNIAILQEALNNFGQVRFKFNRYDSKGNLEPTSDYGHVLSPYHLVVYHDNFYCIGLKQNDKRVWHYRIDLMTDVEIIRNADGEIVPIELTEFSGLPIMNTAWDPEKYMSEHLNMAYDEPRDILIKIRNTDYTILHDWFGNHYEKTNNDTENGYDIVRVTSSPSMIVHLAMQYAGAVEIMDADIRIKIKEEIQKLQEKYK